MPYGLAIRLERSLVPRSCSLSQGQLIYVSNQIRYLAMLFREKRPFVRHACSQFLNHATTFAPSPFRPIPANSGQRLDFRLVDFGHGEEVNEHMTRIAVTIAAIALCFVAVASAKSTGDPRVCTTVSSANHARECAREYAISALRGFMTRKESDSGWDATISCTGSNHWLRWFCTFRNDKPEKGSAVIVFGKAPAWKRTVTLKSYVSGPAAVTPGPGG